MKFNETGNRQINSIEDHGRTPRSFFSGDENSRKLEVKGMETSENDGFCVKTSLEKGKICLATKNFVPGEVILEEKAFVFGLYTTDLDESLLNSCLYCEGAHNVRHCEYKNKILNISKHYDIISGLKCENTSSNESDVMEESFDKEEETLNSHTFNRTTITKTQNQKSENHYLFQCIKIDDFIENGLEFSDLDIEGDRLRAFVKCISRYRSNSTSLDMLLNDMTAWNISKHYDVVIELRRRFPELLWFVSDEIAARILSVLATNCHEMDDIQGSGLFSTCCRMEHSCDPNCSFTTYRDHCWLTAIRPISNGEALSIDYGNNYYREAALRQRELYDSYGFFCQCNLCAEQIDKSRAFHCKKCPRDANCIVYPSVNISKGFSSKDDGLNDETYDQYIKNLMDKEVDNSWYGTKCGTSASRKQITLYIEEEEKAKRLLKEIEGANAFKEDKQPEGNMEEDSDKISTDSDSSDFPSMDSDSEGYEMDENIDPNKLEQDWEQWRSDTLDSDSQNTQLLHPKHFAFFWRLSHLFDTSAAWDATSDLTLNLAKKVCEYLEDFLPEFHHEKFIYWEKCAQIYLARKENKNARYWFEKALQQCEVVTGYNSIITNQLRQFLKKNFLDLHSYMLMRNPSLELDKLTTHQTQDFIRYSNMSLQEYER